MQYCNKRAIKLTMSKFVTDVELVAVPKEAKSLRPKLHTCFCAGWPTAMAVIEGYPFLPFTIGILQSNFCVSSRSWSHECSLLTCLGGSCRRSVCKFSKGSSVSGHLILALHQNILKDGTALVFLLAWSSKNIRRVVRSFLGFKQYEN